MINQQNLCKKEREELSKLIIKKYDSPEMKKCDEIKDYKKQEKCQKEQYKKFVKTPVGKKYEKASENLNGCIKKEIIKRGCLEKKEEYDKRSKEWSKEMDGLLKLTDKIYKKCGKIEDKKEQKKCGKSFNKDLKYYYKSSKVKKIEKEYIKSKNKFVKCMDKE